MQRRRSSRNRVTKKVARASKEIETGLVHILIKTL